MQQSAVSTSAGAPARENVFPRIESVGKRVRVEFAGVTIAESDNALLLHESRLVPVYYFPRADVRTDYLERTEHETHCPFKGQASYWTVRAGARQAENAAWSYENPFDEVAGIKDHISFYWNLMDAWYEDGTRVYAPDREAGLGNVNPLMAWLLDDAALAPTIEDLFARFARGLVEAGVPVYRIRLIIRTLHPQLFARAYTWKREEDSVEEFQAPYSTLESSAYLDSPFAAIIEGAGGVRRRLDVPNPQLDYPILKDILEEGATDYVAMPMTFTDGQINVVSLSTDRPGGFSTADLGCIYEIMPVLGRLFEAHCMRITAETLLDTYLGRLTGRRVLEGRIKRGDGDNVHAVIWFCDLRESTALSEAMPRAEFLTLLNEFLEAMAGAVLDAGGEVLRFIGDAALAIFPITGDAGLETPEAARKAVRAAKDALARMREINARRAADGAQVIDFGIGLHLGDVTYGNIGAPNRLEFTVIGAAANEAARIEALTKELGARVVMSERFNQCFPGTLVSLGRHALRGVGEVHEIFTLPPENAA